MAFWVSGTTSSPYGDRFTVQRCAARGVGTYVTPIGSGGANLDVDAFSRTGPVVLFGVLQPVSLGSRVAERNASCICVDLEVGMRVVGHGVVLESYRRLVALRRNSNSDNSCAVVDFEFLGSVSPFEGAVESIQAASRCLCTYWSSL